MKTIIVYASKHGTTSYLADEIKKLLIKDEVKLHNLNEQSNIDINNFDKVIIGSSIYAGSVLPKVKKFIDNNVDVLLQKEVGIFVCCMFFAKVQEQIEKNFPDRLLQHARSVKHFGGEFRFDDMNFLERLLVKKIAGASESVSNINYKNIQIFINELSEN